MCRSWLLTEKACLGCTIGTSNSEKRPTVAVVRLDLRVVGAGVGSLNMLTSSSLPPLHCLHVDPEDVVV